MSLTTQNRLSLELHPLNPNQWEDTLFSFQFRLDNAYHDLEAQFQCTNLPITSQSPPSHPDSSDTRGLPSAGPIETLSKKKKKSQPKLTMHETKHIWQCTKPSHTAYISISHFHPDLVVTCPIRNLSVSVNLHCISGEVMHAILLRQGENLFLGPSVVTKQKLFAGIPNRTREWRCSNLQEEDFSSLNSNVSRPDFECKEQPIHIGYATINSTKSSKSTTISATSGLVVLARMDSERLTNGSNNDESRVQSSAKETSPEMKNTISRLQERVDELEKEKRMLQEKLTEKSQEPNNVETRMVDVGHHNGEEVGNKTRILREVEVISGSGSGFHQEIENLEKSISSRRPDELGEEDDDDEWIVLS